jgi:hypothetical protein
MIALRSLAMTHQVALGDHLSHLRIDFDVTARVRDQT